MGPEQETAALITRECRSINVQGVVHVHRRVVSWEIECREIVPVCFHLGTDGNGEAQPPEDLHDLVDDPGDRMLGSDPAVPRGHRKVDTSLLLATLLRLQGFT